MNKVIAIIPARSGSKGLPIKNILPLGDKPLIAWSIEAATKCQLVDRVVVSSDSQEIADISRKYGAAVPFLRPKKLGEDMIRVEDVLIHALDWIEKHENNKYDILLLLQPTDVFRNKDIVEKVIRALIKDPKLDTAFAAKPEVKNYWSYQNGKYTPLYSHGYVPRQKRTPIYREDTGIAVATRIGFIKKGRRLGDNIRIIAHENMGDFIDIHTEYDLWLANILIKERGILPNE